LKVAEGARLPKAQVQIVVVSNCCCLSSEVCFQSFSKKKKRKKVPLAMIADEHSCGNVHVRVPSRCTCGRELTHDSATFDIQAICRYRRVCLHVEGKQKKH
jgi:hypothetical protein